MNKYIWIFAIFLLGCIDLPGGVRQPTPRESVAMHVAMNTFIDHRGDPGCRGTTDSNVVVWEGPSEQLQAHCANRNAIACVVVAQGNLWDNGMTIMYVDESLDDRRHHSAIIHEYLHVLRGCWVWSSPPGTGPERIRAGWEVEECPRTLLQDRLHCDIELWQTIEGEAKTRFHNLSFDGGV